MIKKLFQNEKIKNFFNILMIPSIRILPGTIAYFLVMSLVPIVTIIAIICSKFQLTTGDFNPIFNVCSKIKIMYRLRKLILYSSRKEMKLIISSQA